MIHIAILKYIVSINASLNGVGMSKDMRQNMAGRKSTESHESKL